MTPHDALHRLLAGAVLLAVSAGGIISGVVEGVDPTAIATWVGSSGAIGFVAWQVWRDSRAMDAVQETLRDQIEALTTDRDEWRDRAETANRQILELSVAAARHDTPAGTD